MDTCATLFGHVNYTCRPHKKCKATTCQIIGLLSSIINKKTMPTEDVVVMIEEIFTPKAIELFIHQMMDLGASQPKEKLGTIVFWSSKFIRICICHAHGTN